MKCKHLNVASKRIYLLSLVLCSMLIWSSCERKLNTNDSLFKPNDILGESVLKNGKLMERNLVEVRLDSLMKLLNHYVERREAHTKIQWEEEVDAVWLKIHDPETIREFHQDLMDISKESGANPNPFRIYGFKNLEDFFPGTVGNDSSFLWRLPVSQSTDSLYQTKYALIIAEVVIRLKQEEEFYGHY